MKETSEIQQQMRPAMRQQMVAILGSEKLTETAQYLSELNLQLKLMQLKDNTFLQVESLDACGAVIVLLQGDHQPWWTFLSKFRQRFPATPLILIMSQFKEELIRDAINRFQTFQVLAESDLKEVFASRVQAALMEYEFQNSKNYLLRDSVLQNRKLEALTTSLEEKVEERTMHLKASNQELSEKLSRERQVIRFIKDIATQSSYEDFLQVLRKELKRFHRIGEPVLILRTLPGQMNLSYFKSSRYIHESIKTRSEYLKPQVQDDEKLKQHLATLLGRPLAKSFSYRLELQASSLENENIVALIVIEHAFAKDESVEFEEFMQDRLQALGMALDRITLEDQFERFSFRWAKTFDGLKDPLAIIDYQYNVIAANKGFSSQQSPLKCYQIFAQRNQPCDHCPMQSSLQQKTLQEAQLNILDREYRVLSYPIGTQDNEIGNSVVHHYSDRTEEKELYLHLIQNEKMSAIGALAGNIAHELNNPLSGIRSLAQVLQAEASGEEEQMKKDLLEIEKAAARSQKIIKNLLEFAQGSSLSGELVSIDSIVEKTLPMLKTALRMHRLKLNLNSSTQKLQVEPHLIQQVIYNLVNNACQAMSQIGDLTIETWETSEAVGFKVSDTGPGISDALKAKVFSPFYTTKAEGAGTGLGLSLVKSIVERYAGKISIEDVKPHGACFSVQFFLTK